MTVLGFNSAEGKIVEIDAIADPERPDRIATTDVTERIAGTASRSSRHATFKPTRPRMRVDDTSEHHRCAGRRHSISPRSKVRSAARVALRNGPSGCAR
jgi:hypothetical protein